MDEFVHVLAHNRGVSGKKVKGDKLKQKHSKPTVNKFLRYQFSLVNEERLIKCDIYPNFKVLNRWGLFFHKVRIIKCASSFKGKSAPKCENTIRFLNDR